MEKIRLFYLDKVSRCLEGLQIVHGVLMINCNSSYKSFITAIFNVRLNQPNTYLIGVINLRKRINLS